MSKNTKKSDAPDDKLTKRNEGILKELPTSHREGAWEKLWTKSGGLCHLCNQPLPKDGKKVDIDHLDPTSAGGLTTLSNLFLAHQKCNRGRGDMPVELARKTTTFVRWCEMQDTTFTDVSEQYIEDGGQRVKGSHSNSRISLEFDGTAREADLFKDPATGTLYGFMDVPTKYIQNDEDTQPRLIEEDHVKKLAVDFAIEPVHEPSNCRVVPVEGGKKLFDLLQFDGQHKTTAQIILGRDEVPTKLYIAPDEAMLQELVVTIQQGITKRRLSTTDTLRKLSDVIQNCVAEYQEEHGGETPSEKQLIEAQSGRAERNRMKGRLHDDFMRAVFEDKNCRIREYTSTKRDPDFPFTDRTLFTNFISPFISKELTDEPLDDSKKRNTERRQVVMLLNAIEAEMLDEKWEPKPKQDDESLMTRRARNFFKGGCVKWWVKELLLPNIQALLVPKPQWPTLLMEKLSAEKEEKIDDMIVELCSWPIWTEPNEEQMAAFRSNTLKNIEVACSEYDQTTLLKGISK